MKTQQKIFRSILEKAMMNGWSRWEHYVPAFIDGDNERIERVLNTVLWTQRFEIIYSEEFAKAYFGEKMMYLVDISPDWAHDMGDTETIWVNEDGLKKLCKAQLDNWDKSNPCNPNDDKERFEAWQIVRKSIVYRWEHPFDCAIEERPAYDVMRMQMVISNDPIKFLEDSL